MHVPPILVVVLLAQAVHWVFGCFGGWPLQPVTGNSSSNSKVKQVFHLSSSCCSTAVKAAIAVIMMAAGGSNVGAIHKHMPLGIISLTWSLRELPFVKPCQTLFAVLPSRVGKITNHQPGMYTVCCAGVEQQVADTMHCHTCEIVITLISQIDTYMCYILGLGLHGEHCNILSVPQ